MKQDHLLSWNEMDSSKLLGEQECIKQIQINDYVLWEVYTQEQKSGGETRTKMDHSGMTHNKSHKYYSTTTSC